MRYLILLVLTLMSCVSKQANSESKKNEKSQTNLVDNKIKSDSVSEERVGKTGSNIATNKIIVDSTSQIFYTSRLEDELKDTECQYFSHNNDSSSLIVGDLGTILLLEKQSFESESNNLTIQLKECYELYDFIVNELSTLTEKGKILSTKGMIHIDIRDKEKNVINLKKGKTIKIIFKDSTYSNDYLLFDGIKNSEGYIEWKKPQTKDVINEPEMIDIEVPKKGDGDYELYKQDPHSYVRSKFLELKNVSELDIASFNMSSFGWKNIDKFNNIASSSSLSVEIPKEIRDLRTYIVIENINSIVVGKRDDNNIKFDKIPQNIPFHIILIGESNNKFVYHISERSLKNDTSFIISEFSDLNGQSFKNILYSKIKFNI